MNDTNPYSAPATAQDAPAAPTTRMRAWKATGIGFLIGASFPIWCGIADIESTRNSVSTLLVVTPMLGLIGAIVGLAVGVIEPPSDSIVPMTKTLQLESSEGANHA